MKKLLFILLGFFCVLASATAQVTFSPLESTQTWYGFDWGVVTYHRYEYAQLSIAGPSVQIDSNNAWFGPGAVAVEYGTVGGDDSGNGSNDFTVYGSLTVRVTNNSVSLNQGSTGVHIQQTYWSGGWNNDQHADYNLYYDGTAPGFSLAASPATSATTWSKAGTFHITIANLSPSPSGLGAASYHVDSGPWNAFSPNAGIDVSGLSTGVHTVSVTLSNNVGVVSDVKTLSLYVDSTPPTITITSVPLANWYGPKNPGSNTWNVSIAGSASGIASAQYVVGYSATPPSPPITPANFSSLTQLNSGQLGTGGSVSPSIGGDGFYYIMATATSNSGNVATPAISGPYKYDASPPALAIPVAAFAAGGNINLSWTAATQNSNGFVYPAPYSATYAVTYSTDGINYIPTTQTDSQKSGIYTLVFPLTNFYGQNLTFKVTATDSVGNQSSQTVPVSVAPILTMTAQNYPQGNTNQVMEVDIQFSSISSVVVTPQVMKNSFAQFTITRTNQQAGSNVTLPDLTLDPTTIPLDAQGNLTANPVWKIGSDGQSICYMDFVPVSSGAGHKNWLYTLQPTPWFDSTPSSNVVTLPNNEGSVSLNLFDSNGVEYGSTGFGVNANRNFTVQFQGSDADEDHWHYEVDKITQYQAQNGALLTTAQKLSGAALIDYPYSNGYPVQTIPITLTLGDNNLCATWNEGNISDPSLTFKYTYVDVNLKPSGNGGYTITVMGLNGSNVQTTNTSIITRPGEQLSFDLAPAGNSTSTLTYSWDFGDGDAAGNVSAVTYTYYQVPGQTSDTVHHTLTVSINDGTITTQVPLDVAVVDTQEGLLLADETWTGDHTVTGVVEVPQSLTLTIAPPPSSNENIFFSGGLADGFGQGLLIDSGGKLIVNDNVFFNQITGQTGGWGTILVNGSATIGKADISNADRGIAVGSTAAAVTLSNTSLHGNNIGLHVVGSSVTTANGAIITNNLVYGVKEDAGGRPVLTNSTVSTNFRNYYAFDQGLLNIGQINLLNAQSATPNSGNSGDTTVGTQQ